MSFAVVCNPSSKRAADLNAGRFAVEVRNKDWLDARLTDLFREHNVALALTDTSFMPRSWEMKGALDLVTADFAYVRWLGNRKGIECCRIPRNANTNLISKWKWKPMPLPPIF